MTDLGLIVTLASLGVTALVWLVRLEGRVNSHDREIKDVKEVHDRELKDVKEGHDNNIQQIRRDLEYIRGRIDSALAKS